MAAPLGLVPRGRRGPHLARASRALRRTAPLLCSTNAAARPFGSTRTTANTSGRRRLRLVRHLGGNAQVRTLRRLGLFRTRCLHLPAAALPRGWQQSVSTPCSSLGKLHHSTCLALFLGPDLMLPPHAPALRSPSARFLPLRFSATLPHLVSLLPLFAFFIGVPGAGHPPGPRVFAARQLDTPRALRDPPPS